MIKEIDVHELAQLLKQDTVTLIDVREPDEFQESSIPGAINMPLSTFDPSAVKVAKDTSLVFQCRSGKRSMKACELYQDSFPDSAPSNLEGGILEWQKKR
jgi:rhodanese-related sulfurtransferase